MDPCSSGRSHLNHERDRSCLVSDPGNRSRSAACIRYVVESFLSVLLVQSVPVDVTFSHGEIRSYPATRSISEGWRELQWQDCGPNATAAPSKVSQQWQLSRCLWCCIRHKREPHPPQPIPSHAALTHSSLARCCASINGAQRAPSTIAVHERETESNSPSRPLRLSRFDHDHAFWRRR
jgi:hypothetical protein